VQFFNTTMFRRSLGSILRFTKDLLKLNKRPINRIIYRPPSPKSIYSFTWSAPGQQFQSMSDTYIPLWSSGQSFWLQILGSRVRFSALPDFLRSSGSGTGSTQPREDN
jgi:hypothetical protein